MTKPSSSPQHVLVCIVLFYMKEYFDSANIKDQNKNNRIIFEHVIFAVAEYLRKNNVNLGWQTKFIHNKVLSLDMITLKNVLKQCVKQQWLVEPSIKKPNYHMSSSGMTLITELMATKGYMIRIKDNPTLIFDRIMLGQIKTEVHRLLALTPAKLKQYVTVDVLRDVAKSTVPLAHYDISDEKLQPFVAGARGA